MTVECEKCVTFSEFDAYTKVLGTQSRGFEEARRTHIYDIFQKTILSGRKMRTFLRQTRRADSPLSNFNVSHLYLCA